MSRLGLRLAGIGLAVAFAVSGCTFSDDLAGQIDRDSRSIERASDEQLLLNIIRAGNGEPIAFTQVSSVLATGTVNGTLGLPFALFGPGPTPPTLTQNGFGVFGTNSLAASSGNNFNLSILDTKEFWLGMLSPLSFDTLNFFIRQGLPRAVLFNLYIAKLDITRGKQPTVSLVNSPTARSYLEFENNLLQNVHYGLTTDAVIRALGVGPPLSAQAASNMKNLVQLAQAGLRLMPVSTRQGTAYQIMSGKMTAVLCFDPAIATTDIQQVIPTMYTCPAITAGPAMVSQPDAGVSGTPFGFEAKSTDNYPSTTYALYPRSTYEILRYLGSLANAEINDPAYVSMASHFAEEEGAAPIAGRLFVVRKNSLSTDDFVSVTYRGNRYSIPADAKTTIQVMALVRQLIALSTSVNSLPVTGTVVTAK